MPSGLVTAFSIISVLLSVTHQSLYLALILCHCFSLRPLSLIKLCPRHCFHLFGFCHLSLCVSMPVSLPDSCHISSLDWDLISALDGAPVSYPVPSICPQFCLCLDPVFSTQTSLITPVQKTQSIHQVMIVLHDVSKVEVPSTALLVIYCTCDLCPLQFPLLRHMVGNKYVIYLMFDFGFPLTCSGILALLFNNTLFVFTFRLCFIPLFLVPSLLHYSFLVSVCCCVAVL